MGNAYASLPVLLGVGPGAAVDVRDLGALKTIIVSGNFNANLVVEASQDGVEWVPVRTFHNRAGLVKLSFAAIYMRVRTGRYGSGNPTVDVAAPNGLVQQIALAAPAGDGSGAMSDTTEFGQTRSIFCGGVFTGSMTVEGSNDGASWSPIATVNSGEFETVERTIARYMRVTRVNTDPGNPGLPVVGVCAAGDVGFADNITTGDPSQYFQKKIYARPGGSDVAGDGTAGNPYQTFVRAMQDIPLVVKAGQFYVVDVTGVNEVLSANDPGGNTFAYAMPAFIGESRGIFDFAAKPSKALFGAVTINADLTVLDTITAADIVSDTADPVTGLRTVVTTKAFVPGAYKGAIIDGPAGSFATGTVWDNDATTLRIVRTNALPTPFDVCSPGAQFSPDGATAFTSFSIDAVAVFLLLNGLDVRGDGAFGTGIYTHWTWGTWFRCGKLSSYGMDVGSELIMNSVFVDRNGTEDCTILGDRFNSTFSYHRNCVFDDNFPRARFAEQTWNVDVMEGCNEIGQGQNVSAQEPFAGGEFVVFNSYIFNGTGVGIRRLAGGKCAVKNTQIDNCAADAVRAHGPGGELRLDNVQGAGNGGVGVALEQGALVQRAGATAVTGAGGDYKVGDNPVAAWGGFAGNENDLAAGSPQLCRMYT